MSLKQTQLINSTFLCSSSLQVTFFALPTAVLHSQIFNDNSQHGLCMLRDHLTLYRNGYTQQYHNSKKKSNWNHWSHRQVSLEYCSSQDKQH